LEEPEEEEEEGAVTMHAAPETAELDAALDTTQQGFCPTSAQGEITDRTLHTVTWAKVQGTSRWCP